MDQNNNPDLAASAERLAAAASALEQILARLEASQESLHAKVDRIIAAIDEGTARNQQASADETSETAEVSERLASLQRENEELKAQASRVSRKTFSPLVSGLLSKNGVEDAAAAVETGTLDKALAALSTEQRIAVKAELARAGMIA
jgi:predicted RNase H-like nuclease (RuvC/YqgF family)